MKPLTKEHKKYLNQIKAKTICVHLCRASILIGFLLLWELLGKYDIIDVFITSSPSRIIATIQELFLEGDLIYHTKVTLYETLISFAISTIGGTLIAIILWSNEFLRRVIEPYIVILNALPKIALGPIIIIIVGVGYTPIITMAVLICIVITTISMLSGFLTVDAGKIMLMKSMNASKFQLLTKLIFPATMPTLLAALKINVGLSWVGTIMGEYLVSKAGLGYLIVYGGQIFKLDLVMASTVILCILAGGMYFIVDFIANRLTKNF